VFGGRLDIDLSPRGHSQAAALARWLHGRHFDALYASPMKRVRQTVAPLLANGMPPPRILEGLREVDFGDWTGLKWDDVLTRFGVSPFSWLEQLERAGIPNAESAASFRARVEPCLRQIVAEHAGQQVAVACHGGTVRMLLAILLDWPLPRLAPFEIEYASVTLVTWRPSEARLHLLNFTPWRELRS
jgi:broad specificity phosphatase PhoE